MKMLWRRLGNNRSTLFNILGLICALKRRVLSRRHLSSSLTKMVLRPLVAGLTAAFEPLMLIRDLKICMGFLWVEIGQYSARELEVRDLSVTSGVRDEMQRLLRRT